MSFASKLKKQNEATVSLLEHAYLPIYEGGYNAANIADLPPPPVYSSAQKAQETKEIQITIISTRNEIASKQYNRFGLSKPQVPSGSGYTDPQICTLVVEKMWRIVCLKELHVFFTQASLQELVERACKHDYHAIMNTYEITTIDMATDLAVLGLYNIILFADDSGSMSTTDSNAFGMNRYNIMREVFKTIGFFSVLMDKDGIVIRFFNSNAEGNGISNSKEVDELLTTVSPGGSTPLGAMLKSKIYDGMIRPYMNELERPLLIITLTDGRPDSVSDVFSAIRNIRDECRRSKYGQNAISFSFAQIGSDRSATEFLGKLDIEPGIGDIIDCTSEYNIECFEIKNKHGEAVARSFTPASWIVKTMIGAVDPAYDAKDE